MNDDRKNDASPEAQADKETRRQAREESRPEQGDDDIPEEVIERLQRQLELTEQSKQKFLDSLPRAYPPPRAELEWRAYTRLLRWWSRPQIQRFIDTFGTDEMVCPGILDSPEHPSLMEFISDIDLLYEGQYARRLPKSEMLSMLAGPDAAIGRGHRGVQSWEGGLGAEKRWKAQKPVGQIIEKLAGAVDALGDPVPPSELWPDLYSRLDEAGLNPDEPETKPRRYTYDGGEITFEAFRRHVQRRR